MLIKALSEDQSAVIVAIEARALIQEISDRLLPYPPALRHLAQAIIGAGLLQGLSDWEDDEKLELQWSTVGPFGSLCADVLGSGKVRGSLANLRPDVFDFEQGLGSGLLQVRRRSLGGVTTTGLVEAKGNVVEDLLSYLKESEQKYCSLQIHIQIEWDQEAENKGTSQPFKIVDAVGYLIHILPQDSEVQQSAFVELWKQRMNIMGPLSEWAIPKDSSEATKFMIELLTVGSKPKMSSPKSIMLYCTCNEERAKRAIALLNSDDRKSILLDSNENTIDLKCEFCGKNYRIAGDEVGDDGDLDAGKDAG